MTLRFAAKSTVGFDGIIRSEHARCVERAATRASGSDDQIPAAWPG